MSSAFSWAGNLQTGHTPPRPAVLLPNDPLFPNVRRVAVRGDWAEERRVDWLTTWHYAEDGTLPRDETGLFRLTAA